MDNTTIYFIINCLINLIVLFYLFKVSKKLLVHIIRKSLNFIFRNRILEIKKGAENNRLVLFKLQEEINRD